MARRRGPFVYKTIDLILNVESAGAAGLVFRAFADERDLNSILGNC